MRTFQHLVSTSYLFLLALCTVEPFSPDSEALFSSGNSRNELWHNETETSSLINQWPDARIHRFLALRGSWEESRMNAELPRNELVNMAEKDLLRPIITSPTSPDLALFTESQCSQLTVDQIVHWAARHSGYRVNSHGANVFDAPPTLVRSKEKRIAAVKLCEKLYRERVYGDKMLPQRDLSELNGNNQVYVGPEETDIAAQRLFSAQIAEAEAAPHIFEPDINPALDRAAKHSIHDLRALLDVFGVQWDDGETHEILTERAKAHTRLWIGQRPKPSKVPLPPSLPSEWLIGHLRSMPPGSDHTYFAKLGKDLGSDIISFTIMGQTTVVLNSAAAANDLLEKRSLIYSDRPSIMFITDEWLVDWRHAVSMCPYGPRHRTYRKMMNKFISKSAATAYHLYQEAEMRAFLKRLLVSTERLEDDFRQVSGAIIMRATYGYRVRSADNHFVTLAATTNANLMRAGLQSNSIVNVIPILKYLPPWFPGAQWKRDALEWRGQKDIMINETFNWTKRQVREGRADSSIVQTLLEDIPESGMSVEDAEDHIKHIAGTMFPAGSETTVASFMIFILAMTLYPEVQQKGQEEIDRVIGTDRLPTMKDQDSLPYVNAIIEEIIRWQPVTPLGMPHRTVQDDIYKGYLIPKGATVLGNVWAITRDPEVYPDPESFNPDRFYQKATSPAPGFGWGRRICPGQYIAEASLFIAVASMLAAFTIKKARDENGREITPTTKAKESSLVYHPAPFKCDIQPRSAHYSALVSALPV
ncbi:cytochrome P450 family protein [Rhizoctonia solani]|uniref:Cytochrome P450 family protein n=1 Tax=Rhizoctonia solani TaxID=456999 RepID=A0A8H8SZX2_9AGAM|nr:cytochrome P450 family protein [Rhizoctonia solani]QRW22858.1 cytochrome P450 family protein [Rhizoctonia solani]